MDRPASRYWKCLLQVPADLADQDGLLGAIPCHARTEGQLPLLMTAHIPSDFSSVILICAPCLKATFLDPVIDQIISVDEF